MNNPLQWRHNELDGVSNHRRPGCLLNHLSGRRSKKTPKLHVTGLCEGNHQWPMDFPHKGPVTRKIFAFDDVIIPWKHLAKLWTMLAAVLFNLLWEYNHVFLYITIAQHWDGLGSWNPSYWNKKTHLSWIISTTVADVLTACVARASASHSIGLVNPEYSGCWASWRWYVSISVHCSQTGISYQSTEECYRVKLAKCK